jgi:hypothetical protein
MPKRMWLQGEAGRQVTGRRYMFDNAAMNQDLAFPNHGRIAVCYGSISVDAVLDLPAPEHKFRQALDSVPAALWVTVGLLAQDRIAVQIKLQRTSIPTKRDTDTGRWHVYYPVAGALTVLDSVADHKEKIVTMSS